ncbi:YecA/YgfB family protein [Endothiovibrio diazotrophicus]
MNSELNDDEFEELAERLDPDRLGEQAMDLIEAHGLLTALAVGPVLPPEEAWLALVLGDAPHFDTPDDRRRLVELLHHFLAEVEFVLSDGEPVDLPFEPTLGDDPDRSDLRAWCIAFMEGHLLTEEAWFAADEETVGELLLPVAALSGMLEEREFATLDGDSALARQLAEQLPETVTDLYLHFRLPPEERTPPPPPPPGRGGGGGGKGKKPRRRR